MRRRASERRPRRLVVFLAVLTSAVAAPAISAEAAHATLVTVNIWGAGSVTADHGGIGVCTSTTQGQTASPAKTCAADYPASSSITFTRSPAFGFSFQGWGGGCSAAGTAATCVIRPGSAAIVLEARFYDSVDPRTWLWDTPANPTRSSAAAISFASSEPGSTFQCSLSGASESHPFTPCRSPAAYSALVDGTHSFQVRAIDPWGRVDPSPAAWTWTIDTVPPGRPAIHGPAGAISSRSVTFTFSAAGASRLRCRIDEGPWSPCVSPTRYDRLGDGRHTFAVEATDTAGNASTASRSWTVDTTAPNTRITLGPRRRSARAAAATFRFRSTEGRSRFQCRVDRGPWRSCASPTTYRALSAGPHTFRVRARDRAGNMDATPAVRRWRIR